jgi:hypothetical protein
MQGAVGPSNPSVAIQVPCLRTIQSVSLARVGYSERMTMYESLHSCSRQCGLCGTELPAVPADTIQKRAYFQCMECGLLQMATEDRLCIQDERSRYLKHNNSTRTKGYIAFLERLIVPVVAELKQRGEAKILPRGLDFGSGPYPMLAELMAERGYPLDLYDPLFAPKDKSVLRAHPYEYILCCETIEHFYQPSSEFEFMVSLVEPGGFLAIMTSLRTEDSSVSHWHYAQDETHVALYSKFSMQWIAARYSLNVRFPAPGIIFFDVPSSAESSISPRLHVHDRTRRAEP